MVQQSGSVLLGAANIGAAPCCCCYLLQPRHQCMLQTCGGGNTGPAIHSTLRMATLCAVPRGWRASSPCARSIDVSINATLFCSVSCACCRRPPQQMMEGEPLLNTIIYNR